MGVALHVEVVSELIHGAALVQGVNDIVPRVLNHDDAPPLRLRSDVVTREIDRGMLVVDLESGKTWKLNQVGGEIERRTPVADIAVHLAVRYGAAVESVRNDVELLVESLRREGIIEQFGVG